MWRNVLLSVRFTGTCVSAFIAGHAGQLSQFQALGGSLLEATEDPSQPRAPPASATRHTRNVIACAHSPCDLHGCMAAAASVQDSGLLPTLTRGCMAVAVPAFVIIMHWL
jgi:hypothetical protein